MARTLAALMAALLFAPACSSSDDARSAPEHSGGGGARNTLGDAGDGGSSGSGGAVMSTGGVSTKTSGGTTSSGGASAGGSGGASAGGSGGASAGGSGGAALFCPGTTPPPSVYPTCRKATDCPTGTFGCSLDPVSACGFCQPPLQNECGGDAECGANRVCEGSTIPGGCYCTPPVNPVKRCQSSCAVSACAPDRECGADGHCRPRSCTGGYTCPAPWVCAPARALADANGCAPPDCELDGSSCPAGSRCEPGKNCVLIPCTDGYACALNFTCAASSTAPHGCVRKSCQSDGDCDCGACIGAVCQDRLFVCSLAVP